MKVLQINAVYEYGSTGRIVKDIHTLALQKGIESHVACAMMLSESDDVNIHKIGNVLDRKVHAALCRLGGKQAYFSRRATRRLIKYIETMKPDIVHLHNLHSNYIYLNGLLRYLAEKDIQTIVTLHDCWFYTGGCFHYTHANCDKWLYACGHCPQRREDTPAYLYDASQKVRKDKEEYFSAIPRLTVVGVSEWMREEGVKTFFQKNNSMTIYNGVDTAFFTPTSSCFRKEQGLEDKFVVLGAANKWLAPINRQALELVAEGIGEDGVLVIFGCNGESQRDLPSNVRVVPYTSNREKMRELYAMADVFANCTREESLSLVNVEAQACGTPVVTYANTGAKETVDGVSGFAVESGNAEALLEQILEIKQQGKSYYTEGCRQFVLSKFDRDTNYEQYIQLYKSIYSFGDEEK